MGAAIIFYSYRHKRVETKKAITPLILLGAGASKPFGLKTLQDLTSDIIEHMRNKGYDEIIDKILEAFTKFGLTPDFENVYTVLEALVDPHRGVQLNGPFSAFIAHYCHGFDEIKQHQANEYVI